MSIFYVAAHALIVNKKNKVLVLKRSKYNGYMPFKWDIPGGTVENGETVEQALKRELIEETKINIEPLYPIYAYSNLSQLPDRETIQIVYKCKYIESEIELNPKEHDAYKWVDYSEIKQMDCIAFLDELVKNYKLTE